MRLIIISGSKSKDIIKDISKDENKYKNRAFNALASLYYLELKLREDVENLIYKPKAYTKSPFYATISL